MKFRHIRITLAAAAICAALPSMAQLTFTGVRHPAISVDAEASTGLEAIYVVSDAEGAMASYQSASGSVEWQRYSNLGGGYAEQLQPASDGAGKFSIALGRDDMGYIIKDGSQMHCYWVVNYANHQLELDALNIAAEQDCDRTRLELRGNASPITYYTINGQGKQLSRQLALSYYTLEYDENTEDYASAVAEVELESIETTFGVRAPLCDTSFLLEGDRFLRQWGMPEKVESATYATNAVEAHTSAVQAIRENENEQKIETGGLGGSAPVEIEFHAAVTDAAVFREWMLATDPEFNNVIDRYQQLDLTYTFRENGITYVKFVANNGDGTCEYASEAYEVMVGESDLKCPNAFSPGSSEGVNDEWRVSYKSLVEFECHIFNRWGQELCSFTDPGKGWDGKHNGKLVPPGAYYYVINALGSDGKKYKLSGAINIVRTRENKNDNKQ